MSHVLRLLAALTIILVGGECMHILINQNYNDIEICLVCHSFTCFSLKIEIHDGFSAGDAYPSQVLYIICRYNNVDRVVLSFVFAVHIFL